MPQTPSRKECAAENTLAKISSPPSKSIRARRRECAPTRRAGRGGPPPPPPTPTLPAPPPFPDAILGVSLFQDIANEEFGQARRRAARPNRSRAGRRVDTGGFHPPERRAPSAARAPADPVWHDSAPLGARLPGRRGPPSPARGVGLDGPGRSGAPAAFSPASPAEHPCRVSPLERSTSGSGAFCGLEPVSVARYPCTPSEGPRGAHGVGIQRPATRLPPRQPAAPVGHAACRAAPPPLHAPWRDRARSCAGAGARQFHRAFMIMFRTATGDPWPEVLVLFNEDGSTRCCKLAVTARWFVTSTVVT